MPERLGPAQNRDRRCEIFDFENAEKSDVDAPLLEEKTSEINRLLKLEHHFKLTRAQLVSEEKKIPTGPMRSFSCKSEPPRSRFSVKR